MLLLGFNFGFGLHLWAERCHPETQQLYGWFAKCSWVFGHAPGLCRLCYRGEHQINNWVQILAWKSARKFAIIRNLVEKESRGILEIPNKMKKMHNHEKRALSPPERGRQRSQTELQWGRWWDGQWTSSESTPRESVHCEAHSTRSERPVNQSSQLPSTTSRHRAMLAQDRKHVTKRLTQPWVVPILRSIDLLWNKKKKQ